MAKPPAPSTTYFEPNSGRHVHVFAERPVVRQTVPLHAVSRVSAASAAAAPLQESVSLSRRRPQARVRRYAFDERTVRPPRTEWEWPQFQRSEDGKPIVDLTAEEERAALLEKPAGDDYQPLNDEEMAARKEAERKSYEDAMQMLQSWSFKRPTTYVHIAEFDRSGKESAWNNLIRQAEHDADRLIESMNKLSGMMIQFTWDAFWEDFVESGAFAHWFFYQMADTGFLDTIVEQCFMAGYKASIAKDLQRAREQH